MRAASAAMRSGSQVLTQMAVSGGAFTGSAASSASIAFSTCSVLNTASTTVRLPRAISAIDAAGVPPSAAAFAGSMSYPVTAMPAALRRAAQALPIRPQPMIPTGNGVMLGGSGGWNVAQL